MKKIITLSDLADEALRAAFPTDWSQVAHGRRVADRVSMTYGARPVALLHDVLEDTEFTKELIPLPLWQLHALALVTRPKELTYREYIKKIAESGSRIAVAVKVADTRDHLAPERREWLDGTRLEERYRKALEVLLPAARSLGVRTGK